jgi:hypothetical protein
MGDSQLETALEHPRGGWRPASYFTNGSVQGSGGLEPSVGVSLDGEVKLLVHHSLLLGREVC